jgi:signal transduction histidine kinase
MAPPVDNEALAPWTDEFLLKVIHDIRAPLRKMYTRAQLLQEGIGDLAEESRSHMAAILEANRDADAFLTRLSEYFFCGSDWNGTNAIQIRFMISGVLARLSRQKGNCQVNVVLAELADVAAPRRIENVLLELLDNAFKFRKAAGVVVVTATGNEKEYKFTIEDDGIGFDTKFRDLIVKPLERLHPSSDYPGYGLGLAICTRLLEPLGGKLGMDSTPDRGTKAWFTLPRVTFSPSPAVTISR